MTHCGGLLLGRIETPPQQVVLVQPLGWGLPPICTTIGD